MTDRKLTELSLGHPGADSLVYGVVDPSVTSVSKKFAWPGRGINVRDYGAVGDGVTDDTAAIQAAFDACGTSDVLLFPRATYSITAPLDFGQTNGIIIVGDKSVISPSGSGFENSAIIKMVGVTDVYIENLTVDSSAITTTIPHAGIAITRSNTGIQGSGDLRWTGVTIIGYFNYGALYKVSSEVDYFETCLFVNKENTKWAVYIAGQDDAGIGTGVGAISNSMHYFINCTFYQYGDATSGEAPLFGLSGAVYQLTVLGSWGYNTNGGTGQRPLIVFDLLNTTTAASIDQFRCDDFRLESGASGTCFMRVPTGCAIANAGIDGIRTGAGAPITGIEVSGSASYIRYSPGRLYYNSLGGTVKYIHIKNGGSMTQSEVSVWGDDDELTYYPITVDSGGEYVTNITKMFNGDYPLTGAGNYEDGDGAPRGNVVIKAGIYGNSISARRIFGAFNNASINTGVMDVSDGGKFYINGAYTISVTEFSGGKPGQELTIQILYAANITFVHNASKIILAGGADYTPTVNSTISFVYNQVIPAWVETGRCVV